MAAPDTAPALTAVIRPLSACYPLPAARLPPSRLPSSGAALAGHEPGGCAGSLPWRAATGQQHPRCHPCHRRACGQPHAPPPTCPLSADCAPMKRSSPQQDRAQQLPRTYRNTCKPSLTLATVGTSSRYALISLEQAGVPPLAHCKPPSQCWYWWCAGTNAGSQCYCGLRFRLQSRELETLLLALTLNV